jgi:hypothetical protein
MKLAAWLGAALIAAGCGSDQAAAPPSPTPTAPPPAAAAGCSRTSVGLVPLNDLVGGVYKNEPGGLYPYGSNVRPAGHESEGGARARAIVPVDREGRPDPQGRYVLVSIGMSNTTQEFSAFKTLADADGGREPGRPLRSGPSRPVRAGRRSTAASHRQAWARSR